MSKTVAACLSVAVMGLTVPMGRWLRAIYAAMDRQVLVQAFEPKPFTFATLSRNIALNRLSDRIAAYCGSVLNVFGAKELDRGFGLKRELGVATRGFTIDDLVKVLGLAPPTHLKIDVDNIEDRIVAGATRTLAHSRLRSVSIEIDSQDAAQTVSIERVLAAAGLAAGERHTLEDPRFYNQVFQRL